MKSYYPWKLKKGSINLTFTDFEKNGGHRPPWHSPLKFFHPWYHYLIMIFTFRVAIEAITICLEVCEDSESVIGLSLYFKSLNMGRKFKQNIDCQVFNLFSEICKQVKAGKPVSFSSKWIFSSWQRLTEINEKNNENMFLVMTLEVPAFFRHHRWKNI